MNLKYSPKKYIYLEDIQIITAYTLQAYELSTYIGY